MDDFDVLVVGAGVVGLACAAQLAQTGRRVLVLEAAPRIASGISARNSGVVHAGFYYPPGSARQRWCVAGRALLYDHLTRWGVPFVRCGKLVVATSPDELDQLDALLEQGRANGVEDLAPLTRAGIAALEPQVQALGGLFSAQTGICDVTQYALSLQALLEEHGGQIARHTPFAGARRVAGGWRVRAGGADPVEVTARLLVNSAGLAAPRVAAGIDAMPARHIPAYRLAKGNYVALSGPAPFRHLVYPAPVDGGLGIHATLDLGGQVRFGPDVEWLPAATAPEAVDYAVDPARLEGFAAAIRRYWPGLPDGALMPDYAGCRPKLYGPGEGAADFCLQSRVDHGVDGLINLFGIESPGLTASLAIGAAVAGLA